MIEKERKMNTINQMKNIIVLKDLPSNIIEEAFVIIKANKNVKVLNPTEEIEKAGEENGEKQREYIVKEAEMVINNYIKDTDAEHKIRSNTIKQMENKYRRIKKINTFLSALLGITLFFNWIIK